MIKTIISRHTPRHYLSFLEDVKGAVIWQCIMYRVTGARVRRCLIRAGVGARAMAMRVGDGAVAVTAHRATNTRWPSTPASEVSARLEWWRWLRQLRHKAPAHCCVNAIQRVSAAPVHCCRACSAVVVVMLY